MVHIYRIRLASEVQVGAFLKEVPSHKFTHKYRSSNPLSRKNEVLCIAEGSLYARWRKEFMLCKQSVAHVPVSVEKLKEIKFKSRWELDENIIKFDLNSFSERLLNKQYNIIHIYVTGRNRDYNDDIYVLSNSETHPARRTIKRTRRRHTKHITVEYLRVLDF